MYSLTFSLCRTPDWASTCGFVRDTSREIQAPSLARHGVPIDFTQKERKKTDNPREGWEDGTPPPHRDFKERCVVR